MITDNNPSSVPSETRGRMQLVKPQQTMNSGSTQVKTVNGQMPRPETSPVSNKTEQMDAESQNYLNSLKNRQSAFKALQALDDGTRQEVIAYFSNTANTPQNSASKGLAGAVPTSDMQNGLSVDEQAKLIVDNLKRPHDSKFDEDFDGYKDTKNPFYTISDSAKYAKEYYKNKLFGE